MSILRGRPPALRDKQEVELGGIHAPDDISNLGNSKAAAETAGGLEIPGEQPHVGGPAVGDFLPEAREIGVEGGLEDVENGGEAGLNGTEGVGIDAQFLGRVRLGSNGADVIALFRGHGFRAAGESGFHEEAKERGLAADGGVNGIEGDPGGTGNGGHGGAGIAVGEEKTPGGIEDRLAGGEGGGLAQAGVVGAAGRRTFNGARHRLLFDSHFHPNTIRMKVKTSPFL